MKQEKISELLSYFDPVRVEDFTRRDYLNDKFSFGNSIITHFGQTEFDLSKRFELAIIFASTESNNTKSVAPCQQVREELYHLTRVSPVLRVLDPGNMKTGKSLSDALFILEEVCSIFLQAGINVLIVADNQDLTIGNFNALKSFENDINLVHIGSHIPLEEDEAGYSGYLGHLIANEASSLYNISCLACQAHYTHTRQLNKLSENYFDYYRLGLMRENLPQVEPVLRDADLVSFNLAAVRGSDAPRQVNPSPNGLYAEEACQLARYAGISDRCRAFGFYGISGINKKTGQTARLVAQCLWYCIDGYMNRKHDYPAITINDYTKYIVETDEIDIPIVFYKSEKSKRWWIEVYNKKEDENERVSVIVSCNEADYVQASNNEIPERWWNNFKKLR